MTDPEAPITPTERRELRSLVRLRHRVLRAAVSARKQAILHDLRQELETEYVEQDKAIKQAKAKAERLRIKYVADLEKIGQDFRDRYPTTRYSVSKPYADPLTISDQTRAERFSTLSVRVPSVVAQAQSEIDRSEAEAMTDLAEDALKTDAAKAFLGRIPTVEALLPSAPALHVLESVQAS
jgi:hypothetical protein